MRTRRRLAAPPPAQHGASVQSGVGGRHRRSGTSSPPQSRRTALGGTGDSRRAVVFVGAPRPRAAQSPRRQSVISCVVACHCFHRSVGRSHHPRCRGGQAGFIAGPMLTRGGSPAADRVARARRRSPPNRVGGMGLRATKQVTEQVRISAVKSVFAALHAARRRRSPIPDADRATSSSSWF